LHLCKIENINNKNTMRKVILILVLISSVNISYSQLDTIFANNEKIICNIKEITPEAVIFRYPNEEINNSIYNNSIQKIVFKNGRTQKFNQLKIYKKIDEVSKYDDVSITKIESEIKGLYKIGYINSKAVGNTIFSKLEEVKERAYKKLKILAAFQGGNIIYLTEESIIGTNKANTFLTGILYTNEIPDIQKFSNLIIDKKEFNATKEFSLENSSMDMEQRNIKKSFKIEKITNENGMIMIEGALEGESKVSIFRVVSFNVKFFNIYYMGEKGGFNIQIEL
jgi:hypothetical protein